MRLPNILQLVTNSYLGGTERMVLNYLVHATPGRHRNHVGTLIPGGDLLRLAAQAGVETVDFGWRPGTEARTFWSIYRYMRRAKVDLVHLYGLKAEMFGRLAARLARAPVVVSGIRGPEPWHPWYHIALNVGTAWLVDLFVSNSEAGRAVALQREHISPSKVITIHNGVDLAQIDSTPDTSVALRSQYRILLDAPVIGVIANLRSVKRHQDAVDALPAILDRFPDARLLFVGRDEMEGQIQGQVKEMSLEHAVIFAGFCLDVLPFYHLLDIFLLPSSSEGMPVAVLEAMAFSKPVVATNVGGIPELVVHGESGMLIPPQTPAAIASVVTDLLADSERCCSMGRAGRQRVEHHFTIQAVVTNIEDTYDRLLADKRR